MSCWMSCWIWCVLHNATVFRCINLISILFIIDRGSWRQTCQVSRFNRETHDFWCFLTISRLSPQISRFSELMKSSKSAKSSYNKAHSSKETSHFISVLIMRLWLRNVQRQNFVCVMFVLQSKRRVLLSLLSC
jgi:hypothetical protein